MSYSGQSNNVPNGSGNEQQDNELSALLEENKRLKEEMLCIRCRENLRNILFMNCQHFLACSFCATKVFCCPICNEDILHYLTVKRL